MDGSLAPTLVALATRLRLTGLEWRVLAVVLGAPAPVSARRIAQAITTDYAAVKRLVRDLVGWQVLTRTAAGLTLQPDPGRWQSPGEVGHADA